MSAFTVFFPSLMYNPIPKPNDIGIDIPYNVATPFMMEDIKKLNLSFVTLGNLDIDNSSSHDDYYLAYQNAKNYELKTIITVMGNRIPTANEYDIYANDFVYWLNLWNIQSEEYQIWNEVNYSDGMDGVFGKWGNPFTFAEFTKSMYAPIKNARPNSMVSISIGQDDITKILNFITIFLDEGGVCDSINLHWYFYEIYSSEEIKILQDAIESLKKFDIQINLTEFNLLSNVSLIPSLSPSTEFLEEQARVIYDVGKMAIESNCAKISAYSWLAGWKWCDISKNIDAQDSLKKLVTTI